MAAASVAVVAIALLVVPQVLKPQTGTFLVVVAGRTVDALPNTQLQVHGSAGWVVLGQVAGSVPAAPQPRQVLETPLAVGMYDRIRLGSDEASVRVQVIKGQVEPLLLGVGAGRLLPGAAYAGNDELNLGLGELAGKFVTMPAFHLLDQQGRPFDNQTAAGKDLVVAAFHTTCHATCPIYTALFLQLQAKLPAGVELVDVTTDPQTDTPATLAQYATRVGAKWTLATGTADAVTAFWSSFGLGLATGDTHASTLALIDRHGYIRLVYRGVPDVGGTVPAALSGDLNPTGLQELSSHGDSWGAPDILAALLTIAAPVQPQSGTGSAPAFVLDDTAGHRGSPFHGPRVINFWASYCLPCRTEMPLLQGKVGSLNGTMLVLVNEGDSAQHARDFLTAAGVGFPSYLDYDLRVGRAYGVLGLPTTVFVRGDDTIEGRYFGAIDERVLAAHLANMAGK